MATVKLRDIVTDADRAAALAVRAGPGQDRFVASVEQSLRDAVAYAHAKPRYWTVNDGGAVVGFVMLSDGVAPEVVEADPHMVSPYFLWRLLIDHRHQRRGYGAAAFDALVEYVGERPDVDALYTSAVPGEGSPQPFYERYGFVPTGDVADDEVVLRFDLADLPTSAGTLWS
ncbi:MAG TPA: GNAT family N-acetyltransferase [Candidatus Limnocylindria bacterium]|nr:GNAT family N-acetyltransferase [Candidatus Limnocylindria bacterium]